MKMFARIINANRQSDENNQVQGSLQPPRCRHHCKKRNLSFQTPPTPATTKKWKIKSNFQQQQQKTKQKKLHKFLIIVTTQNRVTMHF